MENGFLGQFARAGTAVKMAKNQSLAAPAEQHPSGTVGRWLERDEYARSATDNLHGGLLVASGSLYSRDSPTRGMPEPRRLLWAPVWKDLQNTP
jgi:hypothetical protein